MICPHCNREIDDRICAKHLAGKGGRTMSERKRSAILENAKKAREKRWPKPQNQTTNGD